MPRACRKLDDDLEWVVVRAGNDCPAGFTALPPTNGRANKRLHDVVQRGGVPVQIQVNVTQVLSRVQGQKTPKAHTRVAV